MADSNSYKRTVAGSVGAGVGALFNASGRTYYILEHKTTSKYHNAGESQKIIIDQIEMGRDSSCQVRFDESFETVSRKHAAIVRDGDNWQLVNLSNSNPTLVNGRAIQGSYYLQSGDEIQLSVGGPRLGFIVPQGKQGLTSSIRLTERMNLFRQQALAPYKRAIWILTTLLVLAIVGFGIWTYMLGQQLQQQKEEAIALREQATELTSQIEELEQVAEKTPELEARLENLRNQRARVVTQYRTIIQQVEKKDPDAAQAIEDASPEVNPVESTPDVQQVEPQAPEAPVGVTDLRESYNDIYRIIVEEITLEKDGLSRSAGIALKDIDCGTGFILDNGTFVTARQNVQPWLYVNGVAPSEGWRQRVAQFVAMGFDVTIKFTAYSTLGPSQKMEISSRDFDLPEDGDVISATIQLSEKDWLYVQNLGFTVSKEELKRTGSNIKITAQRGRSYALYRGTGRSGITTNNGISQSISGAHDIEICGYTNNNVQNLAGAVEYFKTSTSNADLKQGTIKIQSAPGAAGYIGAPAFVKDANGVYSVVGVYVGGKSIVPISRCQ